MKPVQSDIDLAPIRARAEAATAGPWVSSMTLLGGEPDCNRRTVMSLRNEPVATLNPNMQTWTARHSADLDFIIHARQDIPVLLDEIARLQAVEHRAKQMQEAEAEAEGMRLHQHPCVVDWIVDGRI